MFRSQRTPPVYDTGRKCIRTLFSRKDIHSQTENKRTHTLNFPLRWLPYIFNYDVECLFKIKKMSIEVHVSKQGYFNYAFNVQPGFIYLRNKINQTSLYKVTNAVLVNHNKHEAIFDLQGVRSTFGTLFKSTSYFACISTHSSRTGTFINAIVNPTRQRFNEYK